MNALAELLSSRGRAEVFRLLFGLSDAPLHLREIQRRAGLSLGTIQQELRKLKRLGLLDSRADGNRLWYQANRGHPLYPEIHRLVLKTSGLVDVLRTTLKDPRIEWAFVFGSIARGEETAGSDVDLMVVGDLGLRGVTSLLSGVADQIGREVNPHVFRRAELMKRKSAGESFLIRILAEPKIFVVGDPREFEKLAG
ncbi:MAG: nucleotidyltransferase domain-containing protein [candidate division NC10 bacterium]|nr:nucleotidyltransferase domain-containing protein [candidate division NC10 bacterium]MBI2563343.1 nucleotidyltransferase domain-containing protein [candidate division NC10 bacterium]MBI3085469.1 nucleotidyltransferase domain-containing protein [candidate division NC10 bacterium]MBI3122026.1 nucleotidyltransferase domain-containing protein [candidate division NC10 bacterium]